jgi:hypothetical protein
MKFQIQLVPNAEMDLDQLSYELETVETIHEVQSVEMVEETVFEAVVESSYPSDVVSKNICFIKQIDSATAMS